MARFVVEVDARSFLRVAARLDQATTDWRRFFEKGLGPIILRMVDQNFRRQGRPGEWTPLHPRTLARRRKGGVGARILADTGRLRQSIVAANAPGHVFQNTPRAMTIGTNLEYANIHQFGGTVKLKPRAAQLRFARMKDGRLLFAGKDGKVKGRRRRIVAEARVMIGGQEITIPARPFLLFQPQDRDSVLRAMTGYLNRVLRPGGFDGNFGPED